MAPTGVEPPGFGSVFSLMHPRPQSWRLRNQTLVMEDDSQWMRFQMKDPPLPLFLEHVQSAHRGWTPAPDQSGTTSKKCKDLDDLPGILYPTVVEP